MKLQDDPESVPSCDAELAEELAYQIDSNTSVVHSRIDALLELDRLAAASKCPPEKIQNRLPKEFSADGRNGWSGLGPKEWRTPIRRADGTRVR